MNPLHPQNRSLIRILGVLTLALAVATGAMAADAPPPPPAAPGRGAAAPAPLPGLILTLDLTSASTIHDRDPGYKPAYLVYADTQRTAEEARKLLDDLGLTAHVEEYKTRVYVLGPSKGEAYDAAADLAVYRDFLRTRRSSNLKVIGIGAGATFVNNVIARRAFAVAGILTYGGTLEANATSTMPVPAYVHAATPAVAKLYVDANGATTKVESETATTYSSPRASQTLQRVVVSKLNDEQETPAQAFQNAWRTVFSKNYRLYMTQVESYAQGFDPNEHAEPWELEPYVMYDELGVRHEALVEDLPGSGLSLRYDYVPQATLTAAAKTVPLVIMMHGNGNDPRTQGESSGWVEVAAKEGLILTSVEWQGRTVQGTAYAAIGEKGTMAILDLLLAKYPQIDPSRVYFTGLSAGAMNSFAYGLNNVSRIAAIAVASAPFGNVAWLEAARRVKADGNYLPAYSIAGTHDMYKPLPVNDTARSYYIAIKALATINDIAVPEAPDMQANEIFGLKLDGQAWGELGATRAMIGTLSNRQGVMIKLVGLDPYGHWNFKPAAADMWAFMSRYRRDLANGKLQVAPGF
jgi:dienelactone hydrolase